MEKKRRMLMLHEPTAAGAGAEEFAVEELEAAREAYLDEQEQEHPSAQVKFRYGVALIRSKKRDNKLRGIALLDDLLRADFEPKQCLYWIALTQFELGDFRSSRNYCERLLRADPTDAQALALHQRLRELTRTESMLSLGLVGVALVVGIGLKLLLKHR